MEKTKFLAIIIILLLVALAGVSALCVWYKIDLNNAKQIKVQQVNEKAMFLAKLFVEKVLQGEAEVNFEDRLKLENAVRDLNDQEIFDQWQKIVNSQSAQETQQNVGTFLNLLLTKISY
jgi:hypothetical protein